MLALLCGCAFSVPTTPAQLAPAPSSASSDTLKIKTAAEVRFASGYTRTLPAGSRWRLAGRLPQGTVYRPVDGVFSIEGRQIHEAWLVIDGASRLVGFYLVGENAFSTLDRTVLLLTETSP